MVQISASERVKLIQKGNALFNNGQYPLAEKIFLTINYQDGLIRLGEYYFNHGNYFRAGELFRQAKFLKGEYSCYLKLGLIHSLKDFHNLKTKKIMDNEINKKIVKTIKLMLKKE